MATVDNQQGWFPYDGSNKGCSQGFCSIYCPQWCYALFPPPPPLSLAGADDESGAAALSPLVIAVISILAVALLLVCYYIFVSKQRASLSFRRRPEEPAAAASASGGLPEGSQASRPGGLEEALVNTVWRLRRGEGPAVGADCPVCLGEFREEESLRLLPKCSHAFHLQCIDTWLESHPNCPLCRDNVMSATPPAPGSATDAAILVAAEEEMIAVVEDPERNEEGEGEEADHGMDVLEIQIGEEEDAELVRPSTPVRSSALHPGRVSAAEVLPESVEAKDCVVAEEGGPCGRGGGELGGGGRSRALRRVLSPARMKRIVLSGRQGRGRRASPLPV